MSFDLVGTEKATNYFIDRDSEVVMNETIGTHPKLITRNEKETSEKSVKSRPSSIKRKKFLRKPFRGRGPRLF